MSKEPSLQPSDRILRLREFMKWTQRDLARQWKVAAGSIAQWELGAYPVPGPVLKLVELVEQELGLAPNAALAQSTVGRTWRSATASFLGMMYFSIRADAAQGLRAELSRAALEKYVQTVGRLKGLSMKMAQLASYTDFVLTVSQQRLMSSVQRTACPMPRHVVVDVFLREFGKTPSQLFAEWTPMPDAVGSIGQVHRAVTFEGQEVAVKVRHQGLHAALSVDLAHLSVADRLASVVLGGQKAGVLANALREHLLRECDYRREAEHLAYFSKAFAGSPLLVVPGVHAELSSEAVLTQTYLRGDSFEQFMNRADPGEKDRAAQALWDYFQVSCYEHQRLNVDPHPGNFVFLGDRVGLLDFGSVQSFSPGYLELTADIMRCVAERRPERFRERVMASGIVTVPDRVDMQHMYRIFALFFAPWLLGRPFHFRPDYVRAMWRLYAADNPNLRGVHFSEDMLFFHQYFFGLTSVMARLSATVSARPVAMRMLYGDRAEHPQPYSAAELNRLSLGHVF